MKKHSFLFLILFLIPFAGFSQGDITVGSPYAVIDAKEKYYFNQGDEILTIKIDKKKVVLQKLSSSKLSFLKIKVYDDMPNDYVLESVMEFNNRFFIFYSLWDRSKEKEQLFYREIDFEKGSFIGVGTRIVQVDGKVTGLLMAGKFYNFDVVDKFDFFVSSDNSKMLIQYRAKPEVKSDDKSYDIIGMNVFDKNLDPVWNKEIKMPYTEKKMNNIDYSIDSEGNAYVLSTVYDDNTTDLKKNKNGEANYHIELLRIKANTSNINITPVKVDNKFINKIWLYESPNNYMICAGFYNNGRDLDDADGIVLFKAGKEGKVFDLAYYEIPLEVMNQYMSEKSQRKLEKKDNEDKAEFEELELKKLLIQKDGSLLLIGEQYFMQSHTYYSNGRSRTTYTYHYNDLLVTKIDASGKLSWMKKLPKRQVGSNGMGGMSYSYMHGENSHYFLFLDNKKNVDLPTNRFPAAHSDGHGGILTSYKVSDSKGDVNKTYLLDIEDVKGMELYQFTTERILPIASKEFVFEAYKKKKEDILIKVNLK